MIYVVSRPFKRGGADLEGGVSVLTTCMLVSVRSYKREIREVRDEWEPCGGTGRRQGPYKAQREWRGKDLGGLFRGWIGLDGC